MRTTWLVAVVLPGTTASACSIHRHPSIPAQSTDTSALFDWIISRQSSVFFSHNKSVTNNQLVVLFSHNKSALVISQQPNEPASCPTTGSGEDI
jgi:hypothetical protein